MQRSQPSTSFLKNNSLWLNQLDNGEMLSAMLDLVESTNLYVVDSNQQVLYWGLGMETLSGIKREDALGKSCLPECHILEAISGNDQLIKLTQVNGSKIDIKKYARLLYNNSGLFAGGIGFLSVNTPSAPTASLPKTSGTAIQNFHGLISRSPAMRDVFQIIKNAAETETTVLVRGESGSGKELVANAIHTLSMRHSAPFLAVNCAALSSNLLESELFGHVRGAFTGAVKDHDGLFQRAQGGTLFLDEVAELPLELQAKLLRVLQERNFIPVGGNQSIDVDVRIVAATHRSLREEVKNGHFREDLMYRLRVVPIFLPPLRERREDISLLIWHFIDQHNDNRVRVIEKIEPDAMKLLLDYRWPGNIRELHNVVEYAFAVGRGSTLRLSELPPEFREPRTESPTKSPQKQSLPFGAIDEASAIRKALEQSHDQIGMAAELLGMSRATFWRKRKFHGI